MLHQRRALWTLTILLLGASLPIVLAQPPRPEPEKKDTPDAKKLDLTKLPPDAVIVVAEPGKDPTKLTPKMVHMTPEKYQEYLDEIARLKKLLQGDKPITPSTFQLKGKIDGNFVLLDAQVEFETSEPNTVVWLACAPAQPTDVKLDGHTPLFKSEPNGCSVQVNKPGRYKLNLALTLKLTTKGADQGFELELPRPAIANLDLTLPEGAREVRVGGKPYADGMLALKNSQLAGPLGPGPVDKLDIKWRKPGAGGNTPPVLTATAHVAVQFDDRETLTNVELTLKSEGNPTANWPLLVPLGAVVKLAKEDEPKLLNIGTANQQFAALRTVRLKEPVNELKVTVAVKGPPPRAGTVVPVGPFVLQNAQRQSGTIIVTNNLQDVYLHFVPHGDLERDDAGDAPNATAFRYANVRLPDKPSAPTGPMSLSLLDVEPQSTRGLVVTTVQHALRLEYDEKRNAYVWRVRTTIDAMPFRTGVDHLDVQLPSDCELVKDFARKPDAAEVDPSARPLRFTKLAADPLKPFKLTFEAEYAQAAGDSGKATFVLPRPLDTRDGGGGVTVSVQGSRTELLPPEGPSSLEPVATDAPQPQQQAWRSPHMPDHIDVAWQPYKPRVRASSLADLTLTAPDGRAEGRVQQTLHFYFAHAAPAQVLVHIPDAIADHWKIVRGGEASPLTPTPLPSGKRDRGEGTTRLVTLTQPDKDRGHVLVLEYTFPLPADKDAVTVPLVTPEQVTGGDSKVRVWSEVGAVPSLGGDGWQPGDIEAAANQPTLPVLVAHAPRLDVPLSLHFAEGTAAANVLTDRVLVRVEVGADGVQSYRVRYLLTPLGTDHLDVEFPAPVPSLNLRVLHDRVAVTPEAVDEAGKPTDGSRIARLKLGARLLRKPTVLDVSYQLQALRTGSGALNTSLQPPVLRGDAGRPTTRWQVSLAEGPNLLVLWPDGGPGAEPSWGRRGWLFGPAPDTSAADLDRWFAGGLDVPRGDDESSSLVSATCWRQGVEPLTVVHVPRRAWLLTCSLTFLAVALLLFLLARRTDGGRPVLAGWFWALLALLPIGVAASLFFEPTPAAAVVYGVAPGVVVLLLAVLGHVILQERQRRQIVFLPSFRRGGSSIVRAPSSAARHGEPSTVDAPRTNSSQWPTGEVLPSDGNSANKAK